MSEKEIKTRLKELNIAIVTHTRSTGLSQFLRDWLSPKTKNLIFIGHPLYPTQTDNSTMNVYKKGVLKKTYNSPFLYTFGMLLYLKDAFFTIYFILKSKETIDITIGVDNLNTIVLLLLKKLNFIKKVVYHTVDFTPNRFSNKILNFIYHWIDRYCCYHADIIWNSSGRMTEGRVKNGLDESRMARVIITPDGSNFDPKKRLPIDKINRKMVVFLGHLRERLGIELLIEGFSDVVKKEKDAKLLIIGDGHLSDKLKKMTQKLGISKNVIFTGFLERHEDVDKKLKKGAIGIALFEPVIDSFEYYSDAGKPKVYLAAGMPVIITRVPEIADEIDDKKAGLIIPYSKEALTIAILNFLQNNKLYEETRKNAIKLSQKYIWNNIFYDAFSKTLDHLA